MISIDDYLKIFRFRGDTFAIQHRDGSYRRLNKRPTKQHIVDHIETRRKVLALYPAMNDMCYLGVIDLDISHDKSHLPEEWEELKKDVLAVNNVLKDLGLTNCSLTEKTGGRGYHIWLFSELTDSYRMRGLLTKVLSLSNIEGEIFPQLSELGGAIRPPLGTHKIYKSVSEIVDQFSLKTVDLDAGYINKIYTSRVTSDDIDKIGIIKEDTGETDFINIVYDNIPKLQSFNEVLENIRPCFLHIFEEGIETDGSEGWIFMSAAAAEILSNGGTPEHVHEYFSVQKQYQKSKTSKHLGPIMKKNLAPYRCLKLIEDCNSYVGNYCAECPIFKQDILYKHIEEAVDNKRDKELNGEDDIKDTLEQFSFVATELTDLISKNRYTLLVNGFNKGKTWSTIAFLDNLLNKNGGRANYITQTKHAKAIMIDRMLSSEIPFLDSPSNLELCRRAKEFQAIGYVPSVICKGCEFYTPIKDLIKPVTDDFIYSGEKVYGTIEKYRSVAEDYMTCGKWIYLSMLASSKDESLVNISTNAKFSHHLFINDSVYLDSLDSPILFCNIVDQIDYVNRRIPKIYFNELELEKDMRRLGIYITDDIEDLKNELLERTKSGHLDASTLKEMVNIDKIEQWLDIKEKFDKGIMRRVINIKRPDIVSYDLMGDKELRVVLNDVFGKKINPRLYDSVIHYLQNLRVKCNVDDGVARVPMSFREILEGHTNNASTLGLTSTPTDLELLNNNWLSRFRDSNTNVLKNLYSITPETGLGGIKGYRSIVFCKKTKDNNYINDGKTRGDTKKGGEMEEVIIESLQYPKYSEELISDLVQLSSGNLGQGLKIFYQGIISDAITQANKYQAERIFVPNPELFTSLGFDVRK